MSTMIKTALGAAAAMMIAGSAMAAPPAPEFVAKAGASDMYEKQSSKMLLKTTRDAGLRRFASEMVTDHTKSTAMVKAAAVKSGLHPEPPMLDAKQRDMITALSNASDTDRDRLYVDQQKQAHAEALSLMQDYAASGDKPALQDAAGKIVPVVQHHIEMLNGMHM